MRSDAIGLFWQDLPRAHGDRASRVMPPIPETGWQAPTTFPNLSRASALAVDVETYDPHLLKRGPGWARGDGHIVGIAVGTNDGGRWYFPMRHEVRAEENLDPDHVLAWAKDNLTHNVPIVGANLPYDVGWLREEGVTLKGPLYDVQFAEALLHEARTVALEDLGMRYLGEGKESEDVYDWCSAYYGGAVSPSQRKNLYRTPPSLVGPYAEGDVDLPFRVFEKQWPLLHAEGLQKVFDMECRLIYLMVEMRFAGVTIDIPKVERLRERMLEELVDIDNQLRTMVGFDLQTGSNESMARAFDGEGIGYSVTAKGNPSFPKEFLTTIDHPLPKLVLMKREREKLVGTFLESYLLDSHVNGKVFGQFHQLRSDGGGARSGRFSSSTPNLQNIPGRTELGKLIRTCFVPDPGHRRWIKSDYSQIEYRGLAHYAVGPGSDEVRSRYQTDPTTDFHLMVQGIIQSVAGLQLDRSFVKTVNFGTVYGMGVEALAKDLGIPISKAKTLLGALHSAAPFLKATMNAAMDEAEKTGIITTILGRRSRFDMFVPSSWGNKAQPVPFEEAIRLYANPKRAYLHKALNRRLQGTAADQIKVSMLKCWDDGLFHETGVPRLTVHDELDFSDPGGKDHVFEEIYYTMENALPLSVPIKAGREIGPNWGEVQEVT